jgi:prolyl-tRNA synthetase
MKWSQTHLYTIKEVPSDAEIPSHRLLVRGGYLKKLAPGIHSYGPLLLRSIRKFEQIVREEIEREGGAEILMPMVQPKELWQESGRWQAMGDIMQRLKNHKGHEFCLGATHEEVITDYVRHDVKSYRDLPVILFQVQTKFRDEIRPRFGLMRGREFIMKDAYSFDRDKDAALVSYKKMHSAYTKIFQRLGVDFRVVRADSGDIGGDLSEEFHLLADYGEDLLLVAEADNFAANVEVCPAIDAEAKVDGSELLPMEEFETKGLKKISTLAKSLNLPENELVKSLYLSAAGPDDSELKAICVLLRGDDELNPIKLKKQLDLSFEPRPLHEEEVKKVTGAWPGSCGPVGLSIPIYADNGIKHMKNMVVGANKDAFHLRNVNFDRDFKVTDFADLRMAKAGDKNPEGEGVLREVRGIEVGHIFYLGTKYSKTMNGKYLDDEGKEHLMEMGCYGVGVTRSVQAVIESSHDKDGIIWPLSVAPFAVHICLLDPADEKAADLAQQIYDGLYANGYDCLMDDREERPGPKFKDADLLGMPLRVNIGARGLKNNEVELVPRARGEMEKVSTESALDKVLEWLSSQKQK